MAIRAIILSLVLLIGIGAIIPLATEYAEAGPRKVRKYKKKHKKYKKYSKAWWREYNKRKKRRAATAKRKRLMRLRQIRLAKARRMANGDGKSVAATKSKSAESKTQAVLPTGDAAPNGWKSGQNSPNELQFKVDDGKGAQIGSAAISVVGPAMNGENGYTGNKAVGGVPTASLRRTVIDKMVRENGWVVNDYQKEIGGKKVYVVVAQTQESGTVQSRMFYFTEVEGRIYSVATNAPTDASERLAEESEKVINSLQRRTQTAQQAAFK